MDQIDQILAMKTRLTTIKGYAQLIDRQMSRSGLHAERVMPHVGALNREVDRLIALIVELEDLATDGEGTLPRAEPIETHHASSID